MFQKKLRENDQWKGCFENLKQKAEAFKKEQQRIMAACSVR